MVSKTIEKQHGFLVRIAKLILFIDSIGLYVSAGDFFRDHRVHGIFGVKISYSARFSKHKRRLAGDLNVFDENGKYIKDGSNAIWDILHRFWSHNGGGKRVKNDPNHFEEKTL